MLSSPLVFWWGSCYSISTLMCMFCRSLFVLFLFVIVLSVLRFTDSDCPFFIFNLLAIVLSVLRFTDSDYPFFIFNLLAIVLSVLRFTDSDIIPFSFLQTLLKYNYYVLLFNIWWAVSQCRLSHHVTYNYYIIIARNKLF